ncbi:hypothetical protein CRE_31019 [Caenorhabditis remanei]|uniref:G-protein coupled receptors family 1 profile domain-containing protein n=1 Tax=Caenorhabditis remanei TaxID=31234 RepID=E3LU56_CAERE|nr:hypothetical protein CRE_31019 [Caenorhabditis remanei]
MFSYRSSIGHYVLDCPAPHSILDTPPPKSIQIVSFVVGSTLCLPKFQMELILQFGLPVFVLAMYIAVITKILTMKKTSLNKQETRVLVQAVVIFFLFQVLQQFLHLSIYVLQTSSVVFLYCQTFDFTVSTAFLIKRIINTVCEKYSLKKSLITFQLEIMAGAATPCFSFFTSKEIRKMLSARIATISSQGSSHVVVRKPTLVDVD